MANRFTQKAQNVLNASLRFASELGHTYIGSEHLLLGAINEENSIASQLLTERGADAESIKNAVVRLSGIGSPSSVSPADMTPRTKSIIENSLHEAQRNGQDYIGTEHLLSALLNERDCVAVRILEADGVSITDLRNDLQNFLSASTSGSNSEPVASRFGASGEKNRDRKGGLDSAPTLKSFGRDLTELARA
jgi:ATP-dependent Clp protease ATP-binding subunit ClpC